MRILGIDLGSREVKVALLVDGVIKETMKISTMSFYKHYCSYEGKLNVDMDKLGIGSVDYAVSTGYGKNNTNLQHFSQINELKAHVFGAMQQSGLKDFTLLDIGGQDVKVIKVEKGLITDLELNEKCAASCGRYLENMANILEISVEELSMHHEDPIHLNSTCAIFSESELIGRIAMGTDLSNLCAGVNYSLYKRLEPLISNFKGNPLVLSGGVAQNKALIEYLKKDFSEILVLENAQFSGAIGCCYYGNIQAGKKK